MTFYPYYGAQRPVPYLLYQQASDPDLRIDACCKRIASFAGADLLDIGAGNGFHALRFARQCRRVTAVEPDPAMRAQCMAALTSFGQPTNLVVLAGHAAALPIPDHSVDIVHARYAYFFGTDACLPGLAEVRRVLRPGGSCFVIESSNLGDMGRLYRDYFPAVFTNQDAVIDFWGRQGFTQYLVETVWSVPDRATMAAAFALEHDPQQVQEILDRIPGTSLSYVARVFHWRQPGGAS